jgi:TrmH family RNA methyltransferase
MITSIKNPKIKTVRGLLGSKKQRDMSNLMVLEGVRLAEEALNHALEIKECFYSANLSERGKSLLKQIQQRVEQTEEIAADLMDRVSDTQHAQGVLLVCAVPKNQLPPALSFMLALDQINDPGNLGTILRAAAALDVDGVLLTPGTTDPFAPKALRAAMGAQLHLPIQWQDAAGIKALCASVTPSLLLTSSVMDSAHACWDLDLTRPLCLIIGNEANGISSALLSLSDRDVRIPIAEKTESFNAAIAAAILMYEINRQRKTK